MYEEIIKELKPLAEGYYTFNSKDHTVKITLLHLIIYMEEAAMLEQYLKLLLKLQIPVSF